MAKKELGFIFYRKERGLLKNEEREKKNKNDMKPGSLFGATLHFFVFNSVMFIDSGSGGQVADW